MSQSGVSRASVASAIICRGAAEEEGSNIPACVTKAEPNGFE